jgi:hypothetical protein
MTFGSRFRRAGDLLKMMSQIPTIPLHLSLTTDKPNLGINNQLKMSKIIRLSNLREAIK